MNPDDELTAALIALLLLLSGSVAYFGVVGLLKRHRDGGGAP